MVWLIFIAQKSRPKIGLINSTIENKVSAPLFLPTAIYHPPCQAGWYHSRTIGGKERANTIPVHCSFSLFLVLDSYFSLPRIVYYYLYNKAPLLEYLIQHTNTRCLLCLMMEIMSNSSNLKQGMLIVSTPYTQSLCK